MTDAAIARARKAFADADCIVSTPQVDAAYDDLAAALAPVVASDDPVFVVLMNGGFIPAAQILGRLDGAFTVDYLHATRYRNTTQGAGLEWRVRPRQHLADRHVILIDDILDEGQTLAAVQQALTQTGAASVRTVVLCDKAHYRRTPEARADWVGFTVPDRYVFGCGMDLYGYYRQLPAIYAVAGT